MLFSDLTDGLYVLHGNWLATGSIAGNSNNNERYFISWDLFQGTLQLVKVNISFKRMIERGVECFFDSAIKG